MSSRVLAMSVVGILLAQLLPCSAGAEDDLSPSRLGRGKSVYEEGLTEPMKSTSHETGAAEKEEVSAEEPAYLPWVVDDPCGETSVSSVFCHVACPVGMGALGGAAGFGLAAVCDGIVQVVSWGEADDRDSRMVGAGVGLVGGVVFGYFLRKWVCGSPCRPTYKRRGLEGRGDNGE